jgi:hypothetical protein
MNVETHDDLLIKSENEGCGLLIALICDDHLRHIRAHLWFAWKPRILKHIFDHTILHRHRIKNNIPVIKLEDILKYD